MKKLLNSKTMVGGLAMCLVAAAVAYAAVSLDENGVGFVGKGDVQLAFNWNDNQLQTNAPGVTFWFSSEELIEWDCEWDTMTGGKTPKVIHHSAHQQTTAEISSSIAYDARKNNRGKITGFNLNGFVGESTTGGQPTCSQDGGNAVITNETSTIIDAGTIYAVYNDEKISLVPITQ